jgi:hypothetical protein
LVSISPYRHEVLIYVLSTTKLLLYPILQPPHQLTLS